MSKLIILLFLGLSLNINAKDSINYESLEDLEKTFKASTEQEQKITLSQKTSYVLKLKKECQELADALEQFNQECQSGNDKKCIAFFEIGEEYRQKVIRLYEITAGTNFHLGVLSWLQELEIKLD